MYGVRELSLPCVTMSDVQTACRVWRAACPPEEEVERPGIRSFYSLPCEDRPRRHWPKAGRAQPARTSHHDREVERASALADLSGKQSVS